MHEIPEGGGREEGRTWRERREGGGGEGGVGKWGGSRRKESRGR